MGGDNIIFIQRCEYLRPFQDTGFGPREEFRHCEPLRVTVEIGQDDLQVRSKFRHDLPTGSAGTDGRDRIGDNGDHMKCLMALGDRGTERDAFRADGQTVADILDIAASEDFPAICKESCAHQKLGVGSIGIEPGGFRSSDQASFFHKLFKINYLHINCSRRARKSHKYFTEIPLTALAKAPGHAIAIGMKSEAPDDAAPTKAVVEELETLRTAFHGTLQNYAARVDAEIAAISNTVQSKASSNKISSARLRDMRDMLTLLRNSSIKSDKGRRKDLKKIDSILDDLAMLTENW